MGRALIVATAAAAIVISSCCFGGGSIPGLPAPPPPPVSAPYIPPPVAWPPGPNVSCMTDWDPGVPGWCHDFTAEQMATMATAMTYCADGGRLIYEPCPIGATTVGSCIDPGTGVMTIYYGPGWNPTSARDVCALHTPPGLFLGN